MRLNEEIRENKDATKTGLNQFGHDFFDPSGKVRWGDEANAGFLTRNYSERERTLKQYNDTQTHKIEENQIA